MTLSIGGLCNRLKRNLRRFCSRFTHREFWARPSELSVSVVVVAVAEVIGSTNGPQGGGTGGFEYGTKKWLIWGNGGGQGYGDYNTPIGHVQNSFTREASAAAGFGYYPTKGFFSFNYLIQHSICYLNSATGFRARLQFLRSFVFGSYGTIGKIVTPLVTPRRVTVNDRLPVDSPSGSLTIM